MFTRLFKLLLWAGFCSGAWAADSAGIRVIEVQQPAQISRDGDVDTSESNMHINEYLATDAA